MARGRLDRLCVGAAAGATADPTTVAAYAAVADGVTRHTDSVGIFPDLVSKRSDWPRAAVQGEWPSFVHGRGPYRPSSCENCCRTARIGASLCHRQSYRGNARSFTCKCYDALLASATAAPREKRLAGRIPDGTGHGRTELWAASSRAGARVAIGPDIKRLDSGCPLQNGSSGGIASKPTNVW